MRHNVRPTGRSGSYACSCGATFTSLAALQHHIAGERDRAFERSADRAFRRAVRLAVQLEVLLGRHHNA